MPTVARGTATPPPPPSSAPRRRTPISAKRFVDPVTQVAYDNGFVLLDGSTTANDWQVVDGARDPGLEPFDEMPMVERTDYVFNANDSFWVPSAEFELTGDYSILHGSQQTPISMRSRQNASVLGAANTLGLAGADGQFSGLEARDAAFDNTAQTALLLREAAVAACRATPVVTLPDVLAADGVTISKPARDVDLTAACDVLAAWDGRYDLDRAGPLVWRETMSRFSSADRTNTGPLFVDQFDPTAPTASPAVPNPDTTPLLMALATAVDIITTRRVLGRHHTRGGAVHRAFRRTHPVARRDRGRRHDEHRVVVRFLDLDRAERRPRRAGRRRQSTARRRLPGELRHELHHDRRLLRRPGAGVVVAHLRRDGRSRLAAVRLANGALRGQGLAPRRVHRRTDRGRPRLQRTDRHGRLTAPATDWPRRRRPHATIGRTDRPL